MSPGSSDAELKAFFGDLYWLSTREFLTVPLTGAEVDLFLFACAPARDARIVDVGCGAGRHLWEMARRGYRRLVGADFQTDYLRLGRGIPVVAAGDHRALPIRSEATDFVTSFYSSLFYFDLGGNARAMAEVARVLTRGGRFYLATSNPAKLAKSPRASAEHALEGGAQVVEHSEFEDGVERTWRRLTLPDGRVLEGGYAQRHYTPDELETLGATVGLRLGHVCESPTGAPLTDDSTELAAVFTKTG